MSNNHNSLLSHGPSLPARSHHCRRKIPFACMDCNSHLVLQLFSSCAFLGVFLDFVPSFSSEKLGGGYLRDLASLWSICAFSSTHLGTCLRCVTVGSVSGQIPTDVCLILVNLKCHMSHSYYLLQNRSFWKETNFC